MSNKRLEGKVAIITGAASGIGEGAARLFAAHGALIVIADIQDALGQSVAASIGPSCTFHHCDVTDESHLAATVAFTLSLHNRLDIMYSNAGIIGPSTKIINMDLAEFDRTLAVNLRGAAVAIKHAARAMLETKTRGVIICTGSVSATMAGAAPAAYTASKHALMGLVKAAAGELGADGIRVNCVSPWGVATPLTCGYTGVGVEEMEQTCAALSNLKGVVLTPTRVAEAALFLASEEAAFVSGLDMVIDGGYTGYRTYG